MGFLDSFQLKSIVSSSSVPTKSSRAEVERIKNILGIRELEPMPAQAARAFQLSCDPRSTPLDFVKVIESDEVLSARVIRIANSVYFYRGTPANEIEKAVANIGLDELRCILSAALLKGLLQVKHPSREIVWANAVGTAICAKLLARMHPQMSEGEAFLCGLLHDVGKLVMLRRCGELYGKVIQRISGGEHTFVEAEEEIFELNHVEVGRWVAGCWKFPEVVIRAISGHHNRWEARGKSRPTVIPPEMLIKAADTFSHAAALGHTPQMRAFARRATKELHIAFEYLGMSTEEGANFIENCKAQFEKEFGMYELENTNS